MATAFKTGEDIVVLPLPKIKKKLHNAYGVINKWEGIPDAYTVIINCESYLLFGHEMKHLKD